MIISNNNNTNKNNKKNINKNSENYDNNELQNFLLNEAFNNDDSIEEPLNLDKVKSQENKYKKKESKINHQYSNNLKETYKKNFTNNNISVENLNDNKKYYNNNE